MNASTRSEFSPDIAVVGAAISGDLLETLKRVDPMPQIQTYHLQWAVIHAVESAIGTGLRVFSTVPTRDWPYSAKAFWPACRECIAGQEGRATDLTVMPFVSVLGLKQATRFVSCLAWVGKWLLMRRSNRPKVLLLYGLMISHLAAALILKSLFNLRVIAIVTDPPTPNQCDEGVVYRMARKVDRILLRWGMKRLDGIIPLAKPLADFFAPSIPACVVEGMISDEVMKRGEITAHSHFPPRVGPLIFMYAGTLNERCYGIELLLEAIDILKNPDVEFWFFGRGHLEDKVKAAAAKDSRVKYLGLQAPTAHILQRRASEKGRGDTSGGIPLRKAQVLGRPAEGGRRHFHAERVWPTDWETTCP